MMKNDGEKIMALLSVFVVLLGASIEYTEYDNPVPAAAFVFIISICVLFYALFIILKLIYNEFKPKDSDNGL